VYKSEGRTQGVSKLRGAMNNNYSTAIRYHLFDFPLQYTVQFVHTEEIEGDGLRHYISRKIGFRGEAQLLVTLSTLS